MSQVVIYLVFAAVGFALRHWLKIPAKMPTPIAVEGLRSVRLTDLIESHFDEEESLANRQKHMREAREQLVGK